MPESNSSANELTDVSAPLGDVSSYTDIERPVSSRVREGLPPTYRMRADAHYIDHLESRQAAAHEWLDPAVIDAPSSNDDGTLGDLVDSIRRFGVLQPLLVQNSEGRYRLIAGQKRRRAAMLAGVRRVPCMVHEVSDEDARALGAAANIRTASDDAAVAPPAVDTSSEVSRSLETLLFCEPRVGRALGFVARHFVRLDRGRVVAGVLSRRVDADRPARRHGRTQARGTAKRHRSRRA